MSTVYHVIQNLITMYVGGRMSLFGANTNDAATIICKNITSENIHKEVLKIPLSIGLY